ncbi:MAG: phosphoribosylformimino-5-aminoimidazole carboxamide ribotide isomerase, partial [Lachnospiraceae bacterium]|nr:phosphoribosylformimino-5-aminoimidazole carboxamide ribotide isomerase [Lachnospiraceae bacterium]
IILLNASDSEYYPATKKQAMEALRTWPGGLQVGGGINPDNAAEFIQAGASHVIVTSYVFAHGKIHMDRLRALCDAVGKERLVLDLSCRKTGAEYRIVTDRWQKMTETALNEETLDLLACYCEE